MGRAGAGGERAAGGVPGPMGRAARRGRAPAAARAGAGPAAAARTGSGRGGSHDRRRAAAAGRARPHASRSAKRKSHAPGVRGPNGVELMGRAAGGESGAEKMGWGGYGMGGTRYLPHIHPRHAAAPLTACMPPLAPSPPGAGRPPPPPLKGAPPGSCARLQSHAPPAAHLRGRPGLPAAARPARPSGPTHCTGRLSRGALLPSPSQGRASCRTEQRVTHAAALWRRRRPRQQQPQQRAARARGAGGRPAPPMRGPKSAPPWGVRSSSSREG
jgi:hypothetical protein